MLTASKTTTEVLAYCSRKKTVLVVVEGCEQRETKDVIF